MLNIVNAFLDGSNQWFNIVLLTLAGLRIYLEAISYDFSKLPLTNGMFQGDAERAKKFHRSGFILSLGYIVFSAPFTLFA